MQLILRSSYGLVMPILTVAFWGCAHSDELRRPDPGKKIKVFLFAGQSNMEGRANGRELTLQDKERLRNAQNRVQLAFNREPIHPLDVVSPPDEIREIYQRDRIFGPELFFGMALAEALPDERILFIKRTEGATSLYGCWNPDWSKDKASIMGELNKPKLYREFIDYVRSVLDGYSPDDYEICAMLWVQGEGDGKVPQAAVAYGSTLRTLIERVRKDLGRDTLPFILLQVGSVQVVEGMNRTADKVSNVTLIHQSQDADSPDFYEKMENGHYNCDGMKKLGARFAEVFLRTYASPQR
jgi:hypothetical protein